jgi:GT2 family glycosyltransferase
VREEMDKVFVILHYNIKSIKDTIECINSILEKKYKNFTIIVVENGSNDGSLEKLKKFTNRKTKIEILESKKNLGFARGNNLGCTYAKKKYDPNFLIVLNNDTIIRENFLFEIIDQEFKNSRFHVLGPDIINKGDYHINPYKGEANEYDIKYVLKWLEIKEKKIKFSFYNILRKLSIYFQRVRGINKKYSHKKRRENVTLAGAALIFSRRYIEKYEDIFNSSTFLYGEEVLLNLRRIEDDLIYVYTPKLKIYHKEGKATEFKGIEKEFFYIKQAIISRKKILDLIEKEKEI